MSSAGLNKWIVSGNLAADAEIKTVELKSGEKAKVAEATIYVRKPRSRDESFMVKLSIWEGATAWRKLPFLKKGSLIICTGNADPNPYISSTDNLPRAGLAMNVLDIDLDSIRNPEEEAETPAVELTKVVAEQSPAPYAAKSAPATPATSPTATKSAPAQSPPATTTAKSAPKATTKATGNNSSASTAAMPAQPATATPAPKDTTGGKTASS